MFVTKGQQVDRQEDRKTVIGRQTDRQTERGRQRTDGQTIRNSENYDYKVDRKRTTNIQSGKATERQ